MSIGGFGGLGGYGGYGGYGGFGGCGGGGNNKDSDIPDNGGKKQTTRIGLRSIVIKPQPRDIGEVKTRRHNSGL